VSKAGRLVAWREIDLKGVAESRRIIISALEGPREALRAKRRNKERKSYFKKKVIVKPSQKPPKTSIH